MKLVPPECSTKLVSAVNKLDVGGTELPHFVLPCRKCKIDTLDTVSVVPMLL
jgi:hypothetical protein